MQAGDGEGRFGPTDQHQRTLQISRLYLVTVAVTIRGKVNTAGTGDVKLLLTKEIHYFLTLLSVGNLNKLMSRKDARAMWRRHDWLADWLASCKLF